jgi:hypothetical protein
MNQHSILQAGAGRTLAAGMPVSQIFLQEERTRTGPEERVRSGREDRALSVLGVVPTERFQAAMDNPIPGSMGSNYWALLEILEKKTLDPEEISRWVAKKLAEVEADVLAIALRLGWETDTRLGDVTAEQMKVESMRSEGDQIVADVANAIFWASGVRGRKVGAEVAAEFMWLLTGWRDCDINTWELLDHAKRLKKVYGK